MCICKGGGVGAGYLNFGKNECLSDYIRNWYNTIR